jgi:hypothetical protein
MLSLKVCVVMKVLFFLAAHASDWGDSLNQCHRGDKQNTMANMFVGGVVLMLDGILILFSL